MELIQWNWKWSVLHSCQIWPDHGPLVASLFMCCWLMRDLAERTWMGWSFITAFRYKLWRLQAAAVPLHRSISRFTPFNWPESPCGPNKRIRQRKHVDGCLRVTRTVSFSYLRRLTMTFRCHCQSAVKFTEWTQPTDICPLQTLQILN